MPFCLKHKVWNDEIKFRAITRMTSYLQVDTLDTVTLSFHVVRRYETVKKKRKSCFNFLHITFDWTGCIHSSLCAFGYRFGGWHTLDINAALLATNLTDGAHGPHVAFISWAVLGWGQQRFGVEESFGIQGVQASIDWNLTHRTQITVAPDLQLWGVLRWYPGEVTMGRRS